MRAPFCNKMENFYESQKLLSEYLLFHYATPAEMADGMPVPIEALDFPVRLVTELLDMSRPALRALDLGCAVGRSSFEFARTIPSVLGIDFSFAFIRAANVLKAKQEFSCEILVEGERTAPFVARVPSDIDVSRVTFETGDANRLRMDIGTFDVVLAANLLCRLPEPLRFLERLPALIAPGGQLLLATPFSWLSEFTAPAQWVGGRTGPSWEALCQVLESHFQLHFTKDIPFLIREHRRKFQYGISLGSRWVRRA